MTSTKKRYQGKCVYFSKKRGFGFVVIPHDNGGDIFVHRSSIEIGSRNALEIGEHVEFEIVIKDDGKRRAKHVTRPSAKQHRSRGHVAGTKSGVAEAAVVDSASNMTVAAHMLRGGAGEEQHVSTLESQLQSKDSTASVVQSTNALPLDGHSRKRSRIVAEVDSTTTSMEQHSEVSEPPVKLMKLSTCACDCQQDEEEDSEDEDDDDCELPPPEVFNRSRTRPQCCQCLKSVAKLPPPLSPSNGGSACAAARLAPSDDSRHSTSTGNSQLQDVEDWQLPDWVEYRTPLSKEEQTRYTYKEAVELVTAPVVMRLDGTALNQDHRHYWQHPVVRRWVAHEQGALLMWVDDTLEDWEVYTRQELIEFGFPDEVIKKQDSMNKTK